MTRPGALLEELGVARHQVGEEAFSLLGEALAARGRRGAVGAARLGSLGPGVAPASPQTDLAHSALEQLSSIMVQCGRGLDVLAVQRLGQVATLCGKEAAQAPDGQLCPWLGWACTSGPRDGGGTTQSQLRPGWGSYGRGAKGWVGKVPRRSSEG